jgi:predicted AAA+ superfamily ATPase
MKMEYLPYFCNMFQRQIITELEKWRIKLGRKPLVMRGARQVGKTTVVNQFALQFEQYIYLNLELQEDRRPFEKFTTIESLIQSLFFIKNRSLNARSSTLIFIDEIQEVPEALNQLRYFYESAPDIAIIAAGSLLETLFDKNIHFPVGRVEYIVVRPASFPEFLGALGETNALLEIDKVPAAPYIHSKLLQLYHLYALIGGMPEIVNHYATNRDLTALSALYDSLISTYLDDVEKYASTSAQVLHIRHAIRTSFSEAGKRIKFQGFGNSNYRSREMSESLRILEKAMLLLLVYPTSQTTLPATTDIKKSPRLQMLDSGLVNYFIGIQKEILGASDLNDIYRGTMIEQLTGQELLNLESKAMHALQFWVREKTTSSAEVDFLYTYESMLIPIEVKAGVVGKLKSLHQFMELAPHSLAVRFYAGEISITQATTPSGKKYQLLNLPYYLVSQLKHYLTWFQNEIKEN